MRILIFVFLFLAQICSSTVLAQSGENVKRIQGEYETVIHLDSTDYHVHTGVDNITQLIRGINVGENYLILWDLYDAYVFDILTYRLLKKIQVKYLPASVAEYNGEIYYMSGNRLLVFHALDKYDIYGFNSVFTSLSDYQNFTRNTRAGRWPRKPQPVTQLIHQNQTLYFVFFNQAILDFKNDMVVEQDDSGRKFIFPKEILPSQTRKSARNFIGISGEVISINSPSPDAPYFISYSDRKGNILKEFKINRPILEEKFLSNFGIHYVFENVKTLYLYGEVATDSTFTRFKGKIIKFDKELKTTSEIDLPVRNQYNMANAHNFFANFDNSFYQIAINEDLSIDVLKLEVSKYE